MEETAGFIQSIKATAVKGGSTEKYVEVYPHGRAKHGNDRKGDKSNVRYATIGFVAEYGTSSQQARPAVLTVANEKAQEKVVDELEIWELKQMDSLQKTFRKCRTASGKRRIYREEKADSLLHIPAAAKRGGSER